METAVHWYQRGPHRHASGQPVWRRTRRWLGSGT